MLPRTRHSVKRQPEERRELTVGYTRAQLFLEHLRKGGERTSVVHKAYSRLPCLPCSLAVAHGSYIRQHSCRIPPIKRLSKVSSVGVCAPTIKDDAHLVYGACRVLHIDIDDAKGILPRRMIVPFLQRPLVTRPPRLAIRPSAPLVLFKFGVASNYNHVQVREHRRRAQVRKRLIPTLCLVGCQRSCVLHASKRSLDGGGRVAHQGRGAAAISLHFSRRWG